MKIKYSNLLMGALIPLVTLHAEEASLTPPDAKAGECYARVVLPAQYETIEEQVMVKEPSEEISIIEAEYSEVDEAVEVVPKTKKLTPIPPVFEKITQSIEVKPAIRTWKTSLKKKALPVSPDILSAVAKSGVDINGSQPGDCYKEYFIARTFMTETEDIEVRKDFNDTEIIPAEFDLVEQTVIVKPEGKEIVEVPAVYDEVEEKVLVEAEKTVWKKGKNPAQKLSGATGEIMCLVKIPAKYKTIKKRVLVSPATTKLVDVPAVTKVVKVKKLISDAQVKSIPRTADYETVEKTRIATEAQFSWHRSSEEMTDRFKQTGLQVCLTEEEAKMKEIIKTVLVSPASVEEEIVPATIALVPKQVLVSEAKELKTPIEAEYKLMKKRQKISATHVGWKRILCQTNMNHEVISKIQTALNEKGYNAGKADGVLGRGTHNALSQFQKENSLATGGITYETLGSLGVSL